MRTQLVAAVLGVFLLPSAGWGGGTVVQNVPAAMPTLGETGLIALGITLIGAGIALLRRT